MGLYGRQVRDDNGDDGSFRRLVEKDISVEEYVERLHESARERKEAGDQQRQDQSEGRPPQRSDR